MTSQDQEPQTPPHQTDSPFLLTKDELNLAEFPFSLPTHRHPKGKDVIHITIPGTDPKGRPIVREWIARGSADLGLPLATDEEVLLGLFHLWQKEGFKERHIWFTQHRLFTVLGWSPGAQSYARLEQALDRLLGLSIKSNQTFWDKGKMCHVIDGFGLVDSYRLWKRKDQDTLTPFLSRVTFSESIYGSIMAGYMKTLDLNFYLALRFPLSRKLYRFLDKRAYKKHIVEMKLHDLADRLAMTDSAYPSVIKNHLKAPHQELIDDGFLESVHYEEKNDDAWIRYAVVPKQRRRIVGLPSLKPSRTRITPNPLIKELTDRGVTHQVAADLVERFGESRVAEQIEAFDHLRRQNSPQLAKNPPGYLRCAIEEGFAMPTGYVSKAARERKLQEQEAAKRRQDEAKAAEERAERETAERLEALWQTIAADEQTKIIEGILATVFRPVVESYRREIAEGRDGPGCWSVLGERNRILEERFRR